MKRLLLLFAFLGVIVIVSAQEKKSYFSSSSEMIFSFANIDLVDSNGNNIDQGSVVRWTTFFHLQGMYNYNFSKSAGLFAGLAIRNVGYIADDPFNEDTRYKYRTYNLGIPIGIKVGNMDKFFVYGGYEIEFPFHYKEKKFVDNDKVDKLTGYFSDRVNPVQQSWMVGLEIPHGINLKFKYYWTEFHNKDYTYTDDGVVTKPYENRTDNIFYFSICYDLFTPVSDYQEIVDDWK